MRKISLIKTGRQCKLNSLNNNGLFLRDTFLRISITAGSTDMSWDELTQIYAVQGIVPVLGAGVSYASGFPSWEGLLSGIEKRSLPNAEAGTVRFLSKAGYSFPAIASILKQQWLKKRKDRNTPERADTRKPELEFAEIVRETLYQNFPFFPDGIDKSNRRELVREIQQKNRTLRAVASLCAVKPAAASVFERNPRIHSIITFNLDAVLQAYVYARYEKRLLRTVERPSAGRLADKTNIFHMHGFLRFDRKAKDFRKEAPDNLVLSEEEYFDFFNRPTSIFNYTMLYLLREHHCLFIGLSMSDDNLRRLLFYSKNERLKSYLAEGVTKPPKEKIVRHFAVMPKTDSPFRNRIIRDSMENLGVSILWIDTFGEIPEKLGRMYGAEAWQKVY